MSMRQEKIALQGVFRFQVFAEGAQAGAGIENQQMLAATNLKARGVATIFAVLFVRASNGPASAPKTNAEFPGLGQQLYPVLPDNPALNRPRFGGQHNRVPVRTGSVTRKPGPLPTLPLPHRRSCARLRPARPVEALLPHRHSNDCS